MTGEEIEVRVRAVLAEVFGLEPGAIGPGTSTDSVEGWDSLQHLTVVLSLEEEFGIHLVDEDVTTIVNYPLIVETVRQYVDGQSGW